MDDIKYLFDETDGFGEEMPKGQKGPREINNIHRSRSPGSLRRYLFFCTIGVFVLIIIFLFSRGGNRVSVEDFNITKAKLGGLENRLSKLEGTEQKIAHLESQVKKLEQSISKLNRPVASRTEKRRYHKVRQGDSLLKIAQKYGTTVEKLCRFNKITSKTVIRPGQKLLVAK